MSQKRCSAIASRGYWERGRISFMFAYTTLIFKGIQRRFPLNTLNTLFRLSRVVLDLSKYILSGTRKICIYWIILRCFSIIFPKIVNAIYSVFYDYENFSDSYLNHLFESRNCRFPFSAKDSLTRGMKCEKLGSQKSQRIY